MQVPELGIDAGTLRKLIRAGQGVHCGISVAIVRIRVIDRACQGRCRSYRPSRARPLMIDPRRQRHASR
jgi:hypothetical protein